MFSKGKTCGVLLRKFCLPFATQELFGRSPARQIHVLAEFEARDGAVVHFVRPVDQAQGAQASVHAREAESVVTPAPP